MVTVDEETQAKEFLKRAEIRTMKKDLQALREVDALRERDKIAKIKTLEEQLEEKQKQDLASASTKATAEKEKVGMETVLQKNEGQERIAEKDLKNYATEQERQQIFLLESQRLGFEKQIDAIDKEKDPALKLQKNKILLQKRDQQAKLASAIEEEKKLETEQKFITDKEQTTTVPAERKGLEQSRWDLDKKIQDVEKKRWELEKQIQDIDTNVTQIDKSSEELVTEKNELRNKTLGMDKSIREIYSVVMAREEEKRRGEAAEQVAKRLAAEKIRAGENEKVQRQQWTGSVAPKKPNEEGYLSKVPKDFKEKLMKASEAEEEQRKKFLQDVENWDGDKSRQTPNVVAQKTAAPITSPAQPVSVPPAPKRSTPPPVPPKRIT
jgi:hypothetical protein